MSYTERSPGVYNPRQQAAGVLNLAAEDRQRVAAETDPARRSEAKQLHYWTIKAARRINKDIADAGLWKDAITAGGALQRDKHQPEAEKTVHQRR
jgi:hypothetical protein